MSWYRKISSVRDVKKKYLQKVIEQLRSAEEVASVDKIQAEKKLDAILEELDKSSGDILKMPTDIKDTMKSELNDAYKVLRDSPQNFIQIVDGVMVYLDDYMQSLYWEDGDVEDEE